MRRRLLRAGIMSASPRPRTKPRSSEASEYVDTTPDEVFIKVHPARLRALIASKALTRTQVGALLMLALRIDEDRICYPAVARITADIGYKHERHTAKQIEYLESIGVLEVERSDNTSHTYHLPGCFEFGRKTVEGWVRFSALSAHKTVPEEESNSQQESVRREAEQTDLERMLIQRGVQSREAALIAVQYPAALIATVCRQAEQTDKANPGAWIRKTIELRAALPRVQRSAVDYLSRPTGRSALWTGVPLRLCSTGDRGSSHWASADSDALSRSHMGVVPRPRVGRPNGQNRGGETSMGLRSRRHPARPRPLG